MASINLLEEGAEGARGRKKSHEWERKSKVGRLLADKDLLSEAKAKDEEPLHSNVLHVGNRFPKELKPKNSGKGNGKKPIIPAKPKVETIVQQSLSPESDEEKLAELEEKIEKEFSPAEKEFVEWIKENYPNHFQAAKVKMDNKGATINVSAVRQSYIGERIRWGLDKSKWGSNQQLAPEKAELFEEYLKLKLPVGIPEEKMQNPQENAGEIKENNFTSKQSSELFSLIREVAKIRNQIEPSELQEIVEEIIREDLIPQEIFSEDDFQRARDHVIKWITKFNDKK